MRFLKSRLSLGRKGEIRVSPRKKWGSKAINKNASSKNRLLCADQKGQGKFKKTQALGKIKRKKDLLQVHVLSKKQHKKERGKRADRESKIDGVLEIGAKGVLTSSERHKIIFRGRMKHGTEGGRGKKKREKGGAPPTDGFFN